MRYDQECAVLARHFLGDKAESDPSTLPELAQMIQNAVKDYFATKPAADFDGVERRRRDYDLPYAVEQKF